jgi:arylsulfatase A-like enzyme
MSSRSRILCGALVGLLVGLVCACKGAQDAPPERIVLVLVDTLRRDHVGVYGGGVKTPRMDALARQGQAFTDAWSSYHQTTMSMGSLFTGHTPSLERRSTRDRLAWTGRTWCGLLREAEGDEDECIPRAVPTLAEGLREAGYWTAGVVTNKLLYRPGGYERGFDVWRELPGFAPTAVKANDTVREVLDERPRDRFFLYVHYMDVHDYGYRGHSYAKGVRKVDWALGDLLDLLEEEDLREGTLVILTSDHGERLGGDHFVEGYPGHNGNPSFDSLLAVPLLASQPLAEDPQTPVRTDDLHRMILRVAGARPGPAPELEPGELFVSEFEYQTHRRGRWKLFRERESGEVHLVDLEADPGETRDVAVVHPDVRAAQERRVQELADRLATRDAPELELSEEDRARLEALGYVAPDRRARPAPRREPPRKEPAR